MPQVASATSEDRFSAGSRFILWKDIQAVVVQRVVAAPQTDIIQYSSSIFKISMPPQQENENTAESTPTSAVAVNETASTSLSYWEVSTEKDLEGKQLSKLDLSSLEHQHTADADKDGSDTVNGEINGQEEATKSYWDAPAEKGLEGKRLSKLDLSNLEHQRVDGIGEKHMPNKRKSFGVYWEWQNEQFKKTLSNLSLTNCAKQRDGTDVSADKYNDGATPTSAQAVEGTNYWEWQGEKLKQTLSNLSLTNMVKGSRANEDGDENGMGPRRESNGSYWFWRNSTMRSSLDASNSSLTAQEQTTKESQVHERSKYSDSQPLRGSTGGGLYWFWKGGSSTNNLNASDASLTALEKEVMDSENVQSKPNEDSNGSTPGFPITNLQHKMRNSWRQSFQKFSTNSLRKLDEGSAVEDDKKKSWKGLYPGNGKMAAMDDSFEGGSCGSSIGEDDAITF
jgi:hypothetical protein